MRPSSTSTRSILKKIDFFGKKFKFNFSGNSPDFRTPIGGVLTLLATAVLIPLIFVFGRRWVDTSKPTVSTNNVLNNRNKRYKLYQGNILSGLMIFNGADFVHFDETSKYATIKGERLTRFNSSTGEVREYHSSFPFVHCGRISHNTTNEFDRIYGALGAVILSPDVGICADWNVYYQWYIGGSPTQLPYTRMVFKIYPCSLENKADCVGADVLARSQIINNILYNSMDFQNHSKPIKDGIDSDLTPLFSLNTHNKFTIWFKQNQIFDDRDSLAGNGPKFTFFNVEKIDSTVGTRDLTTHCTKISIEDGSCIPYITIEMRMNKIETLIERRYYRIFDLISDVGGMMDIVFYAFAGLLAFYMSRSYQDWMVLQYYGSTISTEELGINPSERLFNQPPSCIQRTLTVQTKKMLKNQKTRDLILKRLEKKMDVMTYLKFSQKAFVLGQLVPDDTYYRALAPRVYFNFSKKIRKEEEKQQKSLRRGSQNTRINQLNSELSQAYAALVSSQPASKFEQKLNLIFKEIIEKSGKIDINTLTNNIQPTSNLNLDLGKKEEKRPQKIIIGERGAIERQLRPPIEFGIAKKEQKFGHTKNKNFMKSAFGRRSRGNSLRFRKARKISLRVWPKKKSSMKKKKISCWMVK